ncbi:MAG TPA: thiol:disulfide interchange protein DsbA/DsbL [Hyphomicrobiales bacterium]|nr:thiol:disulfide interchange protein DsbA/DsbL [Hyphomicrobiales bacterium]
MTVPIMEKSFYFGAWVLLLFCLVPAMQADAQPVVPEPGVHYLELPVPLSDPDPDSIEVAELFWYGCPACYDLLPTLQIWEASYRTADISFSRLPVIWNPVMETHARLYLTADALGLLPAVNKSSWDARRSIHNVIFEALQEDMNPLRSASDAAELFAAEGVQREAFDEAWKSAEVMTRLEELKALPGPDAIPRLPALLVDGRYVITFNDTVRTSEEMFKVMNALIIDMRKARRQIVR